MLVLNSLLQLHDFFAGKMLQCQVKEHDQNRQNLSTNIYIEIFAKNEETQGLVWVWFSTVLWLVLLLSLDQGCRVQVPGYIWGAMRFLPDPTCTWLVVKPPF